MSAELIEWLNILAERAECPPQKFVGHVESSLFFRNAATALEQAEAEVVRLRETFAILEELGVLESSGGYIWVGPGAAAYAYPRAQATSTETTKGNEETPDWEDLEAIIKEEIELGGDASSIISVVQDWTKEQGQ